MVHVLTPGNYTTLSYGNYFVGAKSFGAQMI